MKLPKACPHVQSLERLSQPGVRTAHASVMGALIRGAIARHAYNEPITTPRPSTRVLDFLYCDKSPRDTLSVIMLLSGRAFSLIPLPRSVVFFLQTLDYSEIFLYDCCKVDNASSQLPPDAATVHRYHRQKQRKCSTTRWRVRTASSGSERSRQRR